VQDSKNEMVVGMAGPGDGEGRENRTVEGWGKKEGEGRRQTRADTAGQEEDKEADTEEMVGRGALDDIGKNDKTGAKMGRGGKVIIANTERLLHYIEEGAQEGRQEEGLQKDAVAINTGAHWLLGRYSIEEQRMVIHEPYSLQDIMDSTRGLRDLLEAEGWGIKVVGTHKQHSEDGNTCRYHVLKWVIELIESDKEALRWRAPEYEAEEWVKMVRKEMEEIKAWEAEEERKIEARRTEQKRREARKKRLVTAAQQTQVEKGSLRKMHIEMEEGYWKGLMEKFRIEKTERGNRGRRRDRER